MHDYPQLQARSKAYLLTQCTIPRKMQALDTLQRSFAEESSPFNAGALDNASHPASALSPPEKKRKWENSQDDAEQDMNRALAHMEKAHLILEEHAEGLWTIAMELRAAHFLLDESDEEPGEEDETTVITTFVHDSAERLSTFGTVAVQADGYLKRPLTYFQDRITFNQAILRYPALPEAVYALRQFDRQGLLWCRQALE